MNKVILKMGEIKANGDNKMKVRKKVVYIVEAVDTNIKEIIQG